MLFKAPLVFFVSTFGVNQKNSLDPVDFELDNYYVVKYANVLKIVEYQKGSYFNSNGSFAIKRLVENSLTIKDLLTKQEKGRVGNVYMENVAKTLINRFIYYEPVRLMYNYRAHCYSKYRMWDAALCAEKKYLQILPTNMPKYYNRLKTYPKPSVYLPYRAENYLYEGESIYRVILNTAYNRITAAQGNDYGGETFGSEYCKAMAKGIGISTLTDTGNLLGQRVPSIWVTPFDKRGSTYTQSALTHIWQRQMSSSSRKPIADKIDFETARATMRFMHNAGGRILDGIGIHLTSQSLLQPVLTSKTEYVDMLSIATALPRLRMTIVTEVSRLTGSRTLLVDDNTARVALRWFTTHRSVFRERNVRYNAIYKKLDDRLKIVEELQKKLNAEQRNSTQKERVKTLSITWTEGLKTLDPERLVESGANVIEEQIKNIIITRLSRDWTRKQYSTLARVAHDVVLDESFKARLSLIVRAMARKSVRDIMSEV